MIRRTPQEIADFFGCYVAQNGNGYWYAYEKEPTIVGTVWESPSNSGSGMIGMDLIARSDHPDWTKLYSPNVSENPTGSTVSKTENVEVISEKETTSNKDDYVLAYGDCIAGLTGSVNTYLSEGYMLCGNLVVDGNNFYQPMIKYKK